MGTNDEIFDISHMYDFHDSLQRSGVKCEAMEAPGLGHAFDMWAVIGSGLHADYIKPAVEWVVAAAGIEKDVKKRKNSS